MHPWPACSYIPPWTDVRGNSGLYRFIDALCAGRRRRTSRGQSSSCAMAMARTSWNSCAPRYRAPIPRTSAGACKWPPIAIFHHETCVCVVYLRAGLPADLLSIRSHSYIMSSPGSITTLIARSITADIFECESFQSFNAVPLSSPSTSSSFDRPAHSHRQQRLDSRRGRPFVSRCMWVVYVGHWKASAV